MKRTLLTALFLMSLGSVTFAANCDNGSSADASSASVQTTEQSPVASEQSPKDTVNVRKDDSSSSAQAATSSK